MKIISNPKIALGVDEAELDNLGDWSECYPVINEDNVCIGVVSAFGNPGDLLAGKYNGEQFDDNRQAYV